MLNAKKEVMNRYSLEFKIFLNLSDLLARHSNYWSEIYIPYQLTPRLLLSDSVLVLTGPATPPCLGADPWTPPTLSWFARAEELGLPPTDKGR